MHVYHKAVLTFEVSFSTSNALHSPKLFSALSLIQCNMYYQKKEKHSRNFVRYNNVYFIYQFVTFNPWKVLLSGLKAANYYRRNVQLKLSPEPTTHYLNY